MISEISIINLAKTTPYSLEDIRKIAAQVGEIEVLWDIPIQAKATNSDPFEVLREFEKHGGIFYDGKNYLDEEDMIEDEPGPLTREDIIKAAELITDAFCSIAKNANEILQKPGFKALLSALPEPEQEDEEAEESPLSICPDLLDHATRFEIYKYEIQIKTGRDGVNRWAVYNLGDDVWSREAQAFVWEPQPSDRSDEFIQDTRFTLSEALRIVEDLKK